MDIKFNVCAATELEINDMYTVCVNDDEVLVALFKRRAETARSMPKLNAESQRFEAAAFKKIAIPFLHEVSQSALNSLIKN